MRYLILSNPPSALAHFSAPSKGQLRVSLTIIANVPHITQHA
jgi:hypothetical protein